MYMDKLFERHWQHNRNGVLDVIFSAIVFGVFLLLSTSLCEVFIIWYRFWLVYREQVVRRDSDVRLC